MRSRATVRWSRWERWGEMRGEGVVGAECGAA
jgi:hypothetical protein